MDVAYLSVLGFLGKVQMSIIHSFFVFDSVWYTVLDVVSMSFVDSYGSFLRTIDKRDRLVLYVATCKFFMNMLHSATKCPNYETNKQEWKDPCKGGTLARGLEQAPCFWPTNRLMERHLSSQNANM